MAMRVTLTGDWSKARQILADRTSLKRAIDLAVYQEAQLARGAIVKGIAEQAPGGKKFVPLSPLTLAIRKFLGFGGTKALIVTGTLRGSIVAQRAGPGRTFVGVLRTAKASNGKPLVNIAELQEKGGVFVVRVTPKMRAFLMAALAKYKGRNKTGLKDSGTGAFKRGVMIIKIPARPYIGPVIEQLLQNPRALELRLGRRIARSLNLTMGSV